MKSSAILFTIGLAAAAPLAAQTSDPQTDRQPAAPDETRAAAAAQMVDGEVRKIDKEQCKLTLRHGPNPSLGMPAMTMVYRVKDPSMLDAVKVGDKIRFQAENLNGAYTVTSLEPQK